MIIPLSLTRYAFSLRANYPRDIQNIITHLWQTYGVSVAIVSSYRELDTGTVVAQL
jgi:hypothetical protein